LREGDRAEARRAKAGFIGFPSTTYAPPALPCPSNLV
jgi:hypothetical protein